jgi:hypothetical protein
MRKLIALAVPLAFALAGCDLSAEAEADTVCVTQPFGSPLPAAPAGVTVTNLPLALPATLSVDIGDAVPDLSSDGVTADLPAKSIALTSLEGANLSAVSAATFTLAGPPTTALPDVTFAYARPSPAPSTVVETPATPSAPADLADYLVGQNTIQVQSIAVTLNGQPPTTAWTPALRICFGSRVEVDYLKASGN